MMEPIDGFEHIGFTCGVVMKEIVRRAELRDRLEAEWRRPASDKEFLAIAERTGMRI
jgi:hypothetical protein